MKNFTRAQRKKAKRKFKVGDVVTWESGTISHRVIEVQEHGVVVDATSAGYSRYFVAFDGNARNGVYHREGGRGVRHSSDAPDVRVR
jgi:uncharacterized protein YkvS